MQNNIKKKLKVFSYFILILSLSVNSFSQKNAISLEKSKEFEKSHLFNLNKLRELSQKNDLNVAEWNSFFAESVSAKDTIAYLNGIAILEKKYFPLEHSQFDSVTDYLSIQKYFGSLGSWFRFWFAANKNLLIVLSLILLLSSLLAFVFFKRINFLYFSVFGVLLLLIFNTSRFWLKEEKYLIFDPKYDLMEEASFVSTNLKNEIAKGEMLCLVQENELWYQFEFKNKTYFIPRSQSPFLF